MATPKIIADFETQLNAAISIGDTTFTMSSATDDDGIALPAGLYYFTLDNGSTNKEYLAGTLSGTTVSSVVNVSRQGVEASGAVKAHRVGATVIMTDFMTYKKYMDEIALVSAPDADTTTKGVLEAATLVEVRANTASGGSGAKLAITPDVAVDMPTEDEKAALAGGGDLGTPSDSNKFLTEVFHNSKRIEAEYTADDTWTKPVATNFLGVTIEFIGGGAGGGAGEGGSDGGSSGGGGRGGGTGSLGVVHIPAELLTNATETVDIGIGGLGNTSPVAYGGSAPDGDPGGDTLFGAIATAKGGLPGAAVTGSSVDDLSFPSFSSFIDGIAGGGRTTCHPSSGPGGEGADSFYGEGGAAGTNGGDGVAADPASYGAGGGGAGCPDGSVAGGDGGDGAPGFMKITEYYV